MARRLPLRDPRTVARDIPGVLDILFPRLTGSLVGTLNRTMFSFEGVKPLSDEDIDQSELHNAMLFEIATARAENLLKDEGESGWDEILNIAVERQRQHFDARIPEQLQEHDKELASQAASNLVIMLRSIQRQHPESELCIAPQMPGLGWVSSGVGDFSLGKILIEVKHTDRNFLSRDFRQVFMYWLLKYSACIEYGGEVWTDCLMLNPRRNSGLLFNFDKVLYSASSSSNRVELLELLRSVVGEELERR